MTYTMIQSIAKSLTDDISGKLSGSGIMFRIFSRVKTVNSIRHKVEVKYAGRKSAPKIQDTIGIRIVLYFQDDVDVLSLFFGTGDIVKKSIDEYYSSTFRPQRLNLTKRIPEHMREDFRNSLPEEFRDIIDDTYEIQIRTVFSEGWHEVEHDLRYKCQEDWNGCESYSRVLNGIIATLETAEWNMKSLFTDMARQNFLHGNYTAMIRNKMHLRIQGNGLSESLHEFLRNNKDIAEGVMNADRLIITYTLLTHSGNMELTYDNLLFLINRIEMMDPSLRALEPEETAMMIDRFLAS